MYKFNDIAKVWVWDHHQTPNSSQSCPKITKPIICINVVEAKKSGKNQYIDKDIMRGFMNLYNITKNFAKKFKFEKRRQEYELVLIR